MMVAVIPSLWRGRGGGCAGAAGGLRRGAALVPALFVYCTAEHIPERSTVIYTVIHSEDASSLVHSDRPPALLDRSNMPSHAPTSSHAHMLRAWPTRKHKALQQTSTHTGFIDGFLH